MLDYLAGLVGGPEGVAANQSSSPSFLQNLGGAFGRSGAAGGGLGGLFAALSPQFSGGLQNKPTIAVGGPAAPQPPGQSAGSGGGGGLGALGGAMAGGMKF